MVIILSMKPGTAIRTAGHYCLNNLLEGISQQKGSYLLLFEVREQFAVKVGRLGRCQFKSGAYVYSGSAFGPGGLKARVTRHVRLRKKRHWHIDYVRSRMTLGQVLCAVGTREECDWSERFEESGLQMPVAKFGSSDCQCHSHFFYSPDLQSLMATVRSLDMQKAS